MEASITASSALQGRRLLTFESTTKRPLRLRLIVAMTSMMFRRAASSARKMTAKSMRNMQVPAYCPVVAGFQDEEKRAVVLDVKNVMVIWSIPIIIPDDELPVDVGMAMPAASVVDDCGMGIVMDISMFISKGMMICWDFVGQPKGKSSE
jgi:hypothetical protein